MEERIARVLTILHPVAQHLQHGRHDVGLVRKPLDPLAVIEPTRGVYEKRDMKALFVDGVSVHPTSVLSEALPMVAKDDEDRIVVEPQFLVLVEEVLEEDVLEAEAVEVAVDHLVVRKILDPVTGGEASVVIVSRTGKVFGHERLVPALF